MEQWLSELAKIRMTAEYPLALSLCICQIGDQTYEGFFSIRQITVESDVSFRDSDADMSKPAAI